MTARATAVKETAFTSASPASIAVTTDVEASPPASSTPGNQKSSPAAPSVARNRGPVESVATPEAPQRGPMALPDFSHGFKNTEMPATIPAGPAPAPVLKTTRAPMRAQDAGEAPSTISAERRVEVPVTLTGLKPGQKVRVHLILEIEAEEG